MIYSGIDSISPLFNILQQLKYTQPNYNKQDMLVWDKNFLFLKKYY